MAQPKTIKVKTARFGLIEVPESAMIYIPQGILGFPRSVRYVILDHTENSPIKWLQSVDEPEVAFAMTDPLIFFPDYFLQVKQEELGGLELERIEDLIVYVILSLRSPLEQMSANLQGPILINVKNRRGRQVVLKDGQYHTRHYILPRAGQGKKGS